MSTNGPANCTSGFSILRLLAATACFAVAASLAMFLGRSFPAGYLHMDHGWWLFVGICAAIGGAFGLLRGGVEGFVKGLVTGIMIGAFVPVFLIICMFVYIVLTVGGFMPIPG